MIQSDADNERPREHSAAPQESSPHLARRLGLFDASMIVMGGIIGSGIFMNPSVVARRVHTPFLILLTWALGGLIAILDSGLTTGTLTGRLGLPGLTLLCVGGSGR